MTEESVDVRLARIDERTCAIEEAVNNLREDVRVSGELHEKRYVTRDEFGPVKLAVFSLIGVLSTSVVVALVALVIRK